jgi:hypothetical protein
VVPHAVLKEEFWVGTLAGNYRSIGQPEIVDFGHVLTGSANTVPRRNTDCTWVTLHDFWVDRFGMVDNAVLLQFSGLKPIPVLCLIESMAHFLYAYSWVGFSVSHG